MPIFKINQNKANRVSIKENGFGNEAELRDFFAENLEEILGVRFLGKEYPTTDGRIDTLGIDENNSPVIIEYKWKENEEVLAQGLFYFDWLMKNKKHFELLVDNKLGEKTKVNWEQPRVILVAQGFSRYILSAVQQVKHVELKTYSYYDSAILYIENVYSPIGTKVAKKETAAEDTDKYDLEHHLNLTTDEMKKASNALRKKILELPAVEEKLGQRSGITYRTTKSFARFEYRPKWIQLLLRDPSYKNDIKGLVEDISSNEWGYKGRIKLKPESDIDYVFELIKQSYESTL